MGMYSLTMLWGLTLIFPSSTDFKSNLEAISIPVSGKETKRGESMEIFGE
jgi:hypothetical protein